MVSFKRGQPASVGWPFLFIGQAAGQSPPGLSREELSCAAFRARLNYGKRCFSHGANSKNTDATLFDGSNAVVINSKSFKNTLHNDIMNIHPAPRNNVRLLSICVVLFFALLPAARAQTWYSLQEGDLRSGDDRTTVNTGGTLLDPGYTTGATFIQQSSPDSNFNGTTNLVMSTFNDLSGSYTNNFNRILLSFDLSSIATNLSGQAYSLNGAFLRLTLREAGGAFGATMAFWSTTPFDETTATWNNPGPGGPAGGSLTTLLTTQVVNPATYPNVTEWTGNNLINLVGSTLANPTNKTIYLLLKRNAEGAGDYNRRYVNDENTDPAFGGTDARPELQIGVTILSNAPLVSVTAASPDISESGTNTAVFTISRTINTTNDLTVNFSFSANATSGNAIENVDFTPSITGSVTLPAGVVSTNIVITPIDNSNPDDTRAVILNLASGGTSYGTANASATLNIRDDNDGGALAQWFFGSDTSATVWDTNLTATSITSPALFLPLEPTIVISEPNSLWVQGVFTTNNAEDAIALNDYFTLSVTPKAGHALTLTNLDLMSIYYNNSDINVTNAVLFIRSSLDNYTTNIAAITNLVTDFGGTWQELNVALPAQFTNLTSQVTFRFYVFDDGVDAGLRIDNIYLRGETAAASVSASQPAINSISVSGGNVQIDFQGGSADTPGSFQLQSASSVAGPYADVSSTLIQTGSGQFQSTIPVNGNQQFYRVRRAD
jgi:hypothetical protein